MKLFSAFPAHEESPYNKYSMITQIYFIEKTKLPVKFTPEATHTKLDLYKQSQQGRVSAPAQ